MTKSSPILITADSNDLPLILLHGVELVVWRRAPGAGLVEAIENFDPRRLDQAGRTQPKGKYIDSGRVFLEEKDAVQYPTLAPVWAERRSLKNAFSEALKSGIEMTGIFVQDAIRPGQRDNDFHQDYCTGFDSDEQRLQNEVIFFMTVHKGYGSEMIPIADAGHSEPYEKDHRTSYYHPQTLANLFRGQTHDVMVMKAGIHGTVHRSPHLGEGKRWGTFSRTENTVEESRAAFGPDGMDRLKARYAALTAGSSGP